jgi:hypothetical protein
VCCCIYTIVYGRYRYLAVRSLWSFRHHNPEVPIVVICMGRATPTLRRAAEGNGLRLIEVPEASFAVSAFGDTYLTAVFARFFEVPSLLPPARLYLMVDCDTLCLRRVPLDSLCDRMIEKGALFAAAPEVSPVWQKYLATCRRKLEHYRLGHLAIDETAVMFNAGVVAWRPAVTGRGFPDEFASCLRDAVYTAPEAVYTLPGPDQVFLNVLAQRHAGGWFHPLDSTWNERRAYLRHRTAPEWPVTDMRDDTVIWHCRDSFDRLWTDCYPGQAGRFRRWQE